MPEIGASIKFTFEMQGLGSAVAVTHFKRVEAISAGAAGYRSFGR